jgi:PAS domain S-box-containing protein
VTGPDAASSRLRRKTRQRRLWMAMAGWTLLVALAAAWLIESRLREYREQAIATATVRLNAVKDTLAIALRQLAALPLNMSHRGSVASLLAGTLAPDARDAARRDVQRTIEGIGADFGLPLVSLLDRDGRLVASTGAPAGAGGAGGEAPMQLGDRRYFVEAMARGQSMQFLAGRVSRLPGLYFASRIDYEGAAVGVAVVKQDAETLNRLLRDADGSRVLVSDSNGVVVLANQPDMAMRRLPDAPALGDAALEAVYQRVPPPLDWRLGKLSVDGRAIPLATVNGVPHLALSSPLGDTPLRAWVVDPLDDQPGIVGALGGGAAAVWAAGMLLIWLSGRRLQSMDDALQARRETYELTQALPLTVFRYHQPLRGPARFTFIGRGVDELLGVDAAALERDPALPWRLAGTGEQPPTRPHEFALRRGNATAWLMVDSTPTLEGDGGTTYNGYWLDISRRREAEARFAAVFEHAPAGYVFFGGGHGVTHVNAASLRMFGTDDPSRLLGRTIWFPDLSPELQADGTPSRERAMQGRREHIASGRRVHTLEWRFRRADGSTFDADVSVIALDWEGEPRFCAVIQDITARKQAEAAMRQAAEAAEAASRTKSTFLANMSHELRTPMNAIIGMTHLALEDGLPNKQRDYIEKAHVSARNLLQILNDILDLSKIEAGQMALERIDFELESVVGEMADVLGLRADEKGLELLFSAAPGLPARLVGDPSRLRQVLVNLGGNAIKFTDRGEVVISMDVASEDDGHVELHVCVRDTGVGMSEEQLGRLFTPFMQADSSTTRRFGGTGLGLVISRQLVERMGGRLWARSEPGKGSEFHFTARFGRSAPRAPSARAWMANELRGRRALLADDNAAALDVLGRMLESLGIEVDKAGSGEEALARVDADPARHAWLLLDWKMPGMDGIACAREIVARHPGLQAGIVLVTAFAREDALRAAGTLPVAGVLHKPVTPSNLHDCLVQALHRDARPAAAPPRRAAAPAARPETLQRRLQGARILLVEDHPLNQQLAAELLRRAGMEVAVAGDGREALRRLDEDDAFDGVLMDCQMPVMDGYTATRELRADPRWRELPVIAMTASALAEDRERALASGMNAHVTKPIDVHAMLRTLAEWIRRAPAPAPDAAAPHAPPRPGQSNGANGTAGEPPAIDTAIGLAHCMDNAELYERLLHGFAARESGFVAEVRDALRAGRWGDAERRTHDMKGLAGTLGAQRLRDAAESLQEATQARDERAGAAALAVVEREIGATLAQIGRMSPRRPG